MLSWGIFIATLLIGIILAILPGAILLKTARFSIQDSILFAFPISIAVYTIVGTVNHQIGLEGPFCLLGISLILTVAISILVVLVRRFFSKKNRKANAGKDDREPPHTLSTTETQTKGRIEWMQIAVYAGFNILVMTALFLTLLDLSETIFTFGDNDFHINVIKSMMESGDLSTLAVSQYPDTLPAEQIPFENTHSYYPAGYHIFTALVAAPIGASAPIAENASNFLITAVVFPLGILALLRSVFDNKWLVLTGALTICACATFPLRPLIVHQIYPNIAAIACIPSTVALFYRAFNFKGKPVFSIKHVVFFMISLIGVALLHPNAAIAACISVFSILVASTVPQCVYRLHIKINAKRILTAGSIIGATLLFVAIWMILLDNPALSSITSFVWEWTVSPLIGLLSVLTLALKIMSPNFILAALMFIGVVFCARRKRYWWLILNALLFMIIFYFNAIGSFEIKRIFAGFWYTDPERTSALVAIAVIPLTTCGLYSFILFVLAVIKRIAQGSKRAQHGSYQMNLITKALATCVCIVVFLTLNYMPHVLRIPIRGIGELPSFPATRGIAKEWLDESNEFLLYDQNEKQFVDRVLEITGTDSLIINMPYDGSLYSFPLDDANVFYKSHVGEDDSMNSSVIRTRLYELIVNEEVQQAIKESGARYVMILHKDAESNDDRNHWNPDEWIGIDGITDETPGFEVVLSEGDMRLYRITND